MKEELLKLSNNSYSPYSKFRVSSILILSDGTKKYGVNVESSTYGATICAERSALVSAVSSGVKPGDIKEVHILGYHSKDESKDKYYAYPCGICRHLLSDFSSSDMKVFLYRKLDNEVKEHTFSSLFPHPFNKENLL